MKNAYIVWHRHVFINISDDDAVTDDGDDGNGDMLCQESH